MNDKSTMAICKGYAVTMNDNKIKFSFEDSDEKIDRWRDDKFSLIDRVSTVVDMKPSDIVDVVFGKVTNLTDK